MDSGRLLECCVEEVEVGGVRAIALTRGAEVAVAAAHAVYKEHAVLLMGSRTATLKSLEARTLAASGKLPTLASTSSPTETWSKGSLNP
jgi:hypothetical protein